MARLVGTGQVSWGHHEANRAAIHEMTCDGVLLILRSREIGNIATFACLYNNLTSCKGNGKIRAEYQRATDDNGLNLRRAGLA
ncbi:hypothetical protein ES703_18061 [subsurface metagenome]